MTIDHTPIESFEFAEGMDELKELGYYFDEEYADFSGIQQLEKYIWGRRR